MIRSLLFALPASAQIYTSSFSGDEVFIYDESSFNRIGAGSLVGSGLSNPHGILDRGGDLLIANWSPSEIRRHDRVTGDFLGTFAATGLSNPVYIEVGPDGYLYASSQANDRIYRYPAHGDSSTPVDGGPFIEIPATLNGPSGFDWSPDGSLLYVAGRFSTNVAVFDAGTGNLVTSFDTSLAIDNTFGLAVDDTSGDIYVAVDGNLNHYNSAGTYQATIAIPGSAIGVEPSPDGSAIIIAANNNLYSVALSDHGVSGPLLTADVPLILNFFHFSSSPLPPRTAPLPAEASLIDIAPDRHFGIRFDYSVLPTGEEAVVQLSPDLDTWTDAAIYTPDGVTLTRNAATSSIQHQVDVSGSDRSITERLANSVASQPRGFARVLRRATP